VNSPLDPVSSNSDLLKTAFLAQKPRSQTTWQSIVDDDNSALAFYTKLRKVQKFIGKGQFAHDVALGLRKPDSFKCPEYLERAIKFAVGASLDD
jgi:putative ATP-dependent endonuclease of OLD family